MRILPPHCPHAIIATLGGAALVIALSACSPQGAAPAAPSASALAAANEAAADKELKLYQQMLADHSDALAAPVGAEIVQKYPGTPAAVEVQKTLPQVQTAAKARAEHERLANLWWYQVADVDGAQSTASLYSSEPAATNQRVRLVLRRHVKWGNSVFLFAPEGSKGFVCKDLCTVVMHFNGKRAAWKAYLPKTGEPAMFIKDDARFIKALQRAKVIDMDVTSREHGKETLKFEVGGYDPARFAPLPGH
jgi:hypothetical protein